MGSSQHKTIIPVRIGKVILSDAFEFYLSTDQAIVLERLQKEDSNNLNGILDTIMECINLNKGSEPKDSITSKRVSRFEQNFKPLVEHRKIREAIDILNGYSEEICNQTIIENDESYSLLGYAIKNYWDIQIVDELLKYYDESDLKNLNTYQNVATGENYSLLGYAISCKKIEIVKLLLKSDKIQKNEFVFENKDEKYSAIGLTILKEDSTLLTILIENDVDVNNLYVYKCGDISYSALDYAVMQKEPNLNVIKILLKSNIDFKSFGIYRNRKGQEYSILGYALLYKDIEVLKAMLRYGMDSWYAFKDNENTYSVLGYLILKNDVERLEELLKCGIDGEELNAWKSKEGSYSPLGFAIKIKNMEIIKLLLKYNPGLCNLTSYQNNEESRSALGIAVDVGLLDIIRYLFATGADFNQLLAYKKKEKCYSILAYATKCKNMTLMKWLLKEVSNVNSLTVCQNKNESYSLLGYAIAQGNIELVEKLLSYSIELDETIVYSDGNAEYLALDYAMEIKDSKIIELLLKNGAKIIEPKLEYSHPILKVNLPNDMKCGDIVQIGKYKGMPIEWIVLEVADNKVLLLSKEILSVMPYNNDRNSCTWKTSSLRKWLNDEFLMDAFSKEEQDCLSLRLNVAYRNPKYNTPSGNDTLDKVFLCDFHDLENLDVLDKYNLSKAWWLRTSGFSQKFAMNVENRIHFGGFAVNNPNVGVRPAILLNKK